MKLIDGKMKIGIFKNNIFIEEIQEVDENSEDSVLEIETFPDYQGSSFVINENKLPNQTLPVPKHSRRSARSRSNFNEKSSINTTESLVITRSPIPII